MYGLTHLEEWQWETWDAESRARRAVEEASAPVEVIAEPPEPAHTPAADPQTTGEVESPLHPIVTDSPAISTTGGGTSASIPVTSDLLKSLQYSLSSSISQSHARSADSSHTGAEALPPKSVSERPLSHDSARSHSDHLYNTHVSLSSAPSHAHSTASDNHSSTSTTSIFVDSSLHSDSYAPSSSPHRGSAVSSDVSSLSTLSPSFSSPVLPVPTGGESIYRTIMNRLTVLEANTTLYARYVEEQTAGMREVLRRLTEDIGRLEGIVSSVDGDIRCFR